MCSDKFGKGKEIAHYFQENSSGEGISLVGTDEAGRILIDQLESKIREKYELGIRRFIVVASEGNIITGAIDNTQMIGDLIERLKKELTGSGFYLHIDAAFGGYVVPFLNIDHDFSFYVPQVDSVAIDPHKMGMTPYPSGMFIYKKDDRNLRDYLGVKMGYVPGETDGTLIGSRQGASAAACWALMNYLGRSGYQKIVDSCMQRTNFFKHRMAEISGIKLIPNDMNIVAFRIIDHNLKEFSSEFIDQTKLVKHRYPINLNNPNDCVQMIYKVTIMPHVTPKKIDQFIDLLKKELKKI